MKKVVLGAYLLSLFWIVNSVSASEGNIDRETAVITTNDSLIVYQAENDSLKAQLISADSLKNKKEVGYVLKRMETAYDDEKTPVHPKDLPNAIKSTLSSEDFKDWKTASANFVKPYKGKSYYEIALLKDDDTRIARFKGNGKVL
ncbi:hypothetical protein H8S90_06365 [Olivibacter sp. SDN3]|uniref:hypothetical protein n=1 Tax=Olivibacter sp. SDN3 TaxID=2764720 RepID=UPI00165122DA|nr:hypothetical protein [Olivibacter sp. SDN3]QNL51203.1 hypothetical protein H8S90_06365 [Olivibacter sp. SDN3]